MNRKDMIKKGFDKEEEKEERLEKARNYLDEITEDFGTDKLWSGELGFVEQLDDQLYGENPWISEKQFVWLSKIVDRLSKE
jgi:hypothetical protein